MHFRTALPLGVLLVVVTACGASAVADDADSSEGAQVAGADTNKDPKCVDILSGDHSAPITAAELKAAEPLLSSTGTIPLPSRGPAADGFFYPPRGYVEGGHFSVATGRGGQQVAPADVSPAPPPGVLRFAHWNIQRGNKLDDVVKVMKKINADIWSVNETDFYGLNSQLDGKRVAVGREIARALGGGQGYYFYSTVEFYERIAKRKGTSGTTILSRYPITDGARADIPMLVDEGGHDWSTEVDTGNLPLGDDLLGQPRCGQRVAMAATITVPTTADPKGPTRALKIVSLHTENKSNPQVRLKQFESSIYGGAHPLLASAKTESAIIAGDLNTLEAGEGGDFRARLTGTKLIDTSSPAFPSPTKQQPQHDEKTNPFGRIDWVIAQPGTAGLAVPFDSPTGDQAYRVAEAEGASDHKPVVVELELVPAP